MKEPRVLIGAPTGMVARNPEFYDDLARLEMPNIELAHRTSAHGQSPARNRNIIIDQALEHNCTHIFFLDDDVSFKPDTLVRLLAHDKDIVTGVYLQRNYPHLPIIFDRAFSDGKNAHRFFNDNDNGLVEITNCGLGAVLINTIVFTKLDKPYVRLGQLSKDHWDDDIEFFNRVRAAGFKLYADLECPVGHYFSGCVWPVRNVDGKWCTAIDTNGTDILTFPQVRLQDIPDDVKGQELLARRV